jgi:hypothetical protein
MKKTILSICLLLISFFGFNQDYWQFYNAADGFFSVKSSSLIVENDRSIFIGSSTGLYHFKQGSFINYNTLNSALNSDNIIDMKLGNNKLFIQTNLGISVFDGHTFTNYTNNNGLLSTNINEIQVTSQGVLWIGTANGVSSFDGTQFTHYYSRVAYSLGIDAADNVYIIKKAIVSPNETTFNLEIFKNGGWNSYIINNPDATIFLYDAQFKLLNNGELVVTGYDKPFYRVQDNTFSLITEVATWPSSQVSRSSHIQTDRKGRYWLQGHSNSMTLFTGSLNNLKPFEFKNKFNSITAIDAEANTVAFVTDAGLFVSLIEVKPITTTYDFDVNTIRTSVSSRGKLFYNTDGLIQPGFEFPKGSDRHGIYAAEFLVAAKKSNKNTFSVYPTALFTNNREIGPKNNSEEFTRSFMAKVSKAEILNHIANSKTPGYKVPDGISDWPAIGDSRLNEPADLAPFIDVNFNGCYDPKNGDYPAIKGDLAIYWINRPEQTSDLNDLEYHNMLYGFLDANDPSVNRTVYLERTIINRANVTYDSIKVGLFFDFDIGGSTDDYIGTDSINQIIYAYNGKTFDANGQGVNGYGANPPAVGVKFLDNTLSSIISFNSGSSATNDPSNASDVYNYLNARWKNGKRQTYGGNGYLTNTSNIPTKYAYTGSPVYNNGWTEGNAPNQPGERRAIASFPYFFLQPNQRKTFTVAIGYGFDSITTPTHLNAITAMVNTLNHAKTVYNNIQVLPSTVASNFNCPVIRIGLQEATAPAEDISVYPVPSNGLITISSVEIMKSLQVIDVSGSIILETDLTSKGLAPTIQFPNSIKDGFYFLRIQRQDNSWETKKVVITK